MAAPNEHLFRQHNIEPTAIRKTKGEANKSAKRPIAERLAMIKSIKTAVKVPSRPLAEIKVNQLNRRENCTSQICLPRKSLVTKCGNRWPH